MAYVIYEAARGLVTGHFAGTNYGIDFEISVLVPPAGNVLRTRQESISGVVETNYYGERLIWEVTTAPLQRTSEQAALLREFLRSTDDGQAFEFDPYGIEAAAVEPMNVIREDEGHQEERFLEIDGVNDYVRYLFRVRET